MCLAVPVLVESVENEMAEVVIGGIRRRISVMMTSGAKVGDYVLVHAGYAINIVDEEEALETLNMFAEAARLAGDE